VRVRNPQIQYMHSPARRQACIVAPPWKPELVQTKHNGLMVWGRTTPDGVAVYYEDNPGLREYDEERRIENGRKAQEARRASQALKTPEERAEAQRKSQEKRLATMARKKQQRADRVEAVKLARSQSPTG
jgi:hypothetical protein